MLRQESPGFMIMFWLMLAVAISRIASIYLFQIFDDSFITFRYAANLAEGHGLVYNLGERVQGITTPIWCLVLSLVHLLGLDLPFVSRVLGLILEVMASAILVRYLWNEARLLAIVAVGLFAVDPYLAKTGVGGMESSLFLLLTIVAIHESSRKRWTSAVALTGIAYFVRPEALLLAVLLVVYSVVETRRLQAKPLLIGAVILIAGVGLQYLYYGDIIPQSDRGKFEVRGHLERIIEIAVWSSKDPLQSLLTITSLLGLPYLRQAPKLVILYSLFGLSIFVAWLATSAFIWAWYAVPVYFAKCLITANALSRISESIPVLRGLRVPQHASKLAIAILALTAVSWASLCAIEGPDPVRGVQARLKRLAESRNWTNESAYGVDYGAFGYYARVRMMDEPGLVYPPSLTKYSGLGENIVLGELPEWAFMTVVQDEMSWMLSPELKAMYQPVWRGSATGEQDLNLTLNRVSAEWGHDFMLFKRRDYNVDASRWNDKF